MQINGDKVGDDTVNKYFKTVFSSNDFTALSKGSCDSDGWGRAHGWSRTYDGVTATYWSVGGTEAWKVAAAKKAAMVKA